jgi:hypothetical protein
MDLIDRDRRPERVLLGSVPDPIAVVPAIGREVGDDRCRAGPELGGEGVGVGLLDLVTAVARVDRVLVR